MVALLTNKQQHCHMVKTTIKTLASREQHDFYIILNMLKTFHESPAQQHTVLNTTQTALATTYQHAKSQKSPIWAISKRHILKTTEQPMA